MRLVGPHALLTRRSPRLVSRVDDHGLHFGESFSGSLDVIMDGQRVWSFGTTEATPSVTTIEWPKRLRRRLEGIADVRVVSGDAELFAGEVRFGTGEGRPAFVDTHGTPIFIDKWGLVQRPFDGRREAGVVDAMVQMAQQVLSIMREACDIEGWISFGSLLGAARDGRAIGHDSDIDLNYLSERRTPAEMAVELWDIGRALRSAGLDVQHRSASFVTVRFRVPDGGFGSIDVYTCFYIEDRLHETATVREVVPREAILPLREIAFEGHQLPAPADPARLLSVSYGPGWTVPDPSFRHLPGPEITQRFDGWFGSLMKGRRDWTEFNSRVAKEARADPGLGRPSQFARWVAPQLTGVNHVIEVGFGSGFDLPVYAAGGHQRGPRRVLGLDYAVPRGAGRPGDPRVSARAFNLDDLRDVLTLGAALSRRRGRSAVVARRVLETLTPDSTEAFFLFCRMVLRRGGCAYLEGVARSPRKAQTFQARHESGRVRSLDPARVEERAEAAGGRIVSRAGFEEAARAVRTGPPVTWRLIVAWGADGSEQQPTTERTR